MPEQIEQCLAERWIDHGDDADPVRCERPITHNGDGSAHRYVEDGPDGFFLLVTWQVYEGQCAYPPPASSPVPGFWAETMLRRLLPLNPLFSVDATQTGRERVTWRRYASLDLPRGLKLTPSQTWTPDPPYVESYRPTEPLRYDVIKDRAIVTVTAADCYVACLGTADRLSQRVVAARYGISVYRLRKSLKARAATPAAGETGIGTVSGIRLLINA